LRIDFTDEHCHRYLLIARDELKNIKLDMGVSLQRNCFECVNFWKAKYRFYNLFFYRQQFVILKGRQGNLASPNPLCSL
jgi:hypothetical protein